MRIPAAQVREFVLLHGAPRDTAGGPKEGVPNRVRAGVKFRNRLVTNDVGDSVMTSAEVTLDPENAPALHSMVTVGLGTPYEHKGKVVTAGIVTKAREATKAVVTIE